MHAIVLLHVQCLKVSVGVFFTWLCWSDQNLVMPHQCACIRREGKQALWLVCGSNKPASHTLHWVGKKRELYCFCQTDTQTKAAIRSSLTACPYVKQFKRCNLKDFFFFSCWCWPPFFGSASTFWVRRWRCHLQSASIGVFSWNCLLFFCFFQRASLFFLPLIV